MLKEGCKGPCSWFAECESMCDSKLPCGISLDNVEASLRINQQLKAEILPSFCEGMKYMNKQDYVAAYKFFLNVAEKLSAV